MKTPDNRCAEKRSLPNLALERPITVLMIVATLIGLGVVVWFLIPVEFIMQIDFPRINCWIPYWGANPEQVEKEVAVPAEGEFRTLSNLKMITTSCNAGGCGIQLIFDWEYDMSLATAEVRDRIERLRLRFPPDVDKVFLRRYGSQTFPIMRVALFPEEDVEQLAQNVQSHILPRLMRLEGVAEVEVSGSGTGDVFIRFDQDELRSRNLPLYEVIQRLKQSSVDLSLGELVDGEKTYQVRTKGEYKTPEELARTVVGPGTLRLEQVARVTYSPPGGVSNNTIDGRKGVFLTVLKESEANTLKTCKAVREEIHGALADIGMANTEVFTFWDQSRNILSAFRDLKRSGVLGGALAIGVLFLFLLRVRATLLVAVSIPISLVTAFVFMYFWGMTLNLVTLSAMIITIGMLVDNSIVVIENIHRHQQMGHSPRDSARLGATEVSLAIITSTATTLVVFIPVFYMEAGEMSIYMKEFSIPVTVSLVGSFFVALTVIPLVASRMRERHHFTLYQSLRAFLTRNGNAEMGRLRRALRVVFSWHPLRRGFEVYDRLLALSLRWRLVTFLLVGMTGVFTFLVPYRQVGMQRMPTLDTRQVEIRLQFQQGYDEEMASTVFDRVESILDSVREVLGIRNVYVSPGTEGGVVRAYLLELDDCPPGRELPFSTDDVRDALKVMVSPLVPGGELRFKVAESEGLSSRTLSLRMRGDELEPLRQYAKSFAALVASLPDVTEATTEEELVRKEIQLRIDESLAGRAGISPYVIAQTVDFALRGTRLAYLKMDGREVPITASFREEDKENMGDLDNVAMPGASDRLVTLSQVVSKHKAESPQRIDRVDGKNVIRITAATSGKDLAKLKNDLGRLTSNFGLPSGYDIQMGEELSELETSTRSFSQALVLAIVLIYVVMGALFESYLLPLSILTSVPLAFIGVYWAMWLTGTPMDAVALIGAILMCGVVVNNGIVIVDHINQLRARGIPREEAILEGGHHRLRPVLMTALTTILGCIPLAMGGTQVGEVSFNSLGRALIGGLTTGTFLTLFVVPVFYSLIDDLRIWFLGYFADIAGLRGRDLASRRDAV